MEKEEKKKRRYVNNLKNQSGPKRRELTVRQRKAADALLEGKNFKDAVRIAGYTNINSQSRYVKIMGNPVVREYIEEKYGDYCERNGCNPDYVIKNLMKVVERCLEEKPKMIKDGDVYRQVVDKETGYGVFEFNANGANKALELLGRAMRMFVDRVEVKKDEGLADRFNRATALIENKNEQQ